MTTALTSRLVRTVLIAGLALPVMTLLSPVETFTTAKAATTTMAGPQSEAATLAEFKTILAQYGTFTFHQTYGEVWVPTVTPQGWHPYPACQWVHTKDVGWYFNDDTAWGSIVHHYGRWSHNEQIGWFWVPDEDWSPGWVVWRKSEQWIGWAPMPPEQDIQLISSPEFNNDKLWLFMEAQKFLKGGCGNPVRASRVYNLTQYVTLFDLPPGLFVDIVVVPKWKVKVITKFVTIFIDRICPPPNDRPNPPRPPITYVPPRHTEAQPPVRIGSTTPNVPPPVTHFTPPPPRVVIDLPRHPERIGKSDSNRPVVSEKTPRRPIVKIGRSIEPKPTILRTIGRSIEPKPTNMRGGVTLAKVGQHGRSSVR
jgi:hypothetical protein